MRAISNNESQLREIKYQLAQLAYDQFNLTLGRVGKESTLTFSELHEDIRRAWAEAVWVAVEIGKSKVVCDKVTKKESDNGYLVYAGVKLLMKEHIGKYTYALFPDEIKKQYRELALRIYQVLDTQDDEERTVGVRNDGIEKED